MTSRKDFLKIAGLATITAFHEPSETFFSAKKSNPDMTTLLFQGDSITDAGRSFSKDWNHILGQGYAYLISNKLWFEHIKQPMMFYNRGISGNTIDDLANRWANDALQLQPDILSILVGVNDVLGVIKNNRPTNVAEFKSKYELLLSQTLQKLPQLKIVLCEPFILQVGQVKDQWDKWQAEMRPWQDIVKEIATRFNAVFIALQNIFNKACEEAPADYWIWDGIHPMPAGHQLIAREWMAQVKKAYNFPL